MVHSDISILGFSKLIKALLFLRSFLALPLGYIVSYYPFLIGFFNPMRSMGMKKHVFLRSTAGKAPFFKSGMKGDIIFIRCIANIYIII